MANPLLETAVQSIEIEAFSQDIPDLVFSGTTAYSMFKKKAKTVQVANVTAGGGVTRPAYRVPFRVQSGAAIAQGTGNADAIGRGTGSQYQDFAVSPIYVSSACEISWLAQNATKGKNRGLFNVEAKEMKNSMDSAMQGIEGLINGDGSGALDTIPSTATVNNGTGSGQSTSSIVGLNVANVFSDQQVVQVFPSEGGTARGTFTISYVDGTTNTIYSASALPSGTTTGDFLMVAGSSGAVGSSILGIRAWQVNSNTGTIGGLNRALFPGRLSTPTINLNGGAITPGLAQRALVLLGRALGPDAEAMKSAVWYGAAEQAYAISNNYYNVQITQNIEKGDSVPDTSRQFFPDTFGGREFIKSFTAQPSRLDLLVLDNWSIGELAPLQLHDFGAGQTVVSVPDASQTSSGSWLNSYMFVYESCFNLVDAAPRSGLYVQNAAVPTI